MPYSKQLVESLESRRLLAASVETVDLYASAVAAFDIEQTGFEAARAVGVQDDGSFVVATQRSDNNGRIGLDLFRFQADGTVDPSFGSTIFAELLPPVPFDTVLPYHVEFGADGSIYTVGVLENSAAPVNDEAIFCFKTDATGAYDENYGAAGLAVLDGAYGDNLAAYSAVVNADGSVYISGEIDYAGDTVGQPGFTGDNLLIARFEPSGAGADFLGDFAGGLFTPELENNYNGSITQIEIFENDPNLLAFFPSDPFTNETLVTDTNDDAMAILPRDGGGFVVMVDLKVYGTGNGNLPLFVGFDENFILDTSFGTNGYKLVNYDVAEVRNIVESDGFYFVGVQGAAKQAGVMKLDANFELVTSFGDAGVALFAGASFDRAMDISLDSRGRITQPVEVGSKTNAQPGIVRFTADGQTDTRFGNGGYLTIDTGGPNATVYSGATINGDYFVLGEYVSADPTQGTNAFIFRVHEVTPPLVVTSDNGVLSVGGSDDDDQITFEVDANNPDQLNVYNFGELFGTASNVTRIEISGNAGDDSIDASNVTVTVLASGGEGNDTLQGGSASDALMGDNGNDVLHGNGGDHDVLDGGDGNDALIDHDGVILANGGDGHDLLDLYFPDAWRSLFGQRNHFGISGGKDDDVIRVEGEATDSPIRFVIQGDLLFRDGTPDGNDAVLVYGDYRNSSVAFLDSPFGSRSGNYAEGDDNSIYIGGGSIRITGDATVIDDDEADTIFSSAYEDLVTGE